MALHQCSLNESRCIGRCVDWKMFVGNKKEVVEELEGEGAEVELNMRWKRKEWRNERVKTGEKKKGRFERKWRRKDRGEGEGEEDGEHKTEGKIEGDDVEEEAVRKRRWKSMERRRRRWRRRKRRWRKETV